MRLGIIKFYINHLLAEKQANPSIEVYQSPNTTTQTYVCVLDIILARADAY